LQEAVCALGPQLHTSMDLQPCSIEERKSRPMKKLTCVFRECPTFRAIWLTKARADATHSLQSVAGQDDHGRLIYRGKLYNRRSWSWRPPKIIWSQGRRAHEPPNPDNARVHILKEVLKNGVLCVVAINKCDCGGHLIRDLMTSDLYCEECGLVYDKIVWLREY